MIVLAKTCLGHGALLIEFLELINVVHRNWFKQRTVWEEERNNKKTRIRSLQVTIIHLTCYNRMSQRFPYALPQRTSWPNIALSVELVHVHFLLMLQIYGTHCHHIFAMQLHFHNSRNYLRFT